MVGSEDVVEVEGGVPFAVSRLGSPLMLSLDNENSYMEESGDREWADGMLFYPHKIGWRALLCEITCSCRGRNARLRRQIRQG